MIISQKLAPARSKAACGSLYSSTTVTLDEQENAFGRGPNATDGAYASVVRHYPERFSGTHRYVAYATRSIFERYNIVNERDLMEAGQRLQQYIGRQTSEPPPLTTQ